MWKEMESIHRKYKDHYCSVERIGSRLNENEVREYVLAAYSMLYMVDELEMYYI
jgi:hypothetical protein